MFYSSDYKANKPPAFVSEIREDIMLKVLAIGNSFSIDSMAHLWNMLNESGQYDDVKLGNLAIGGCSLDTHYNNIVNDNPLYEYWFNENGPYIIHPERKLYDKLISEDWDIITIQQVSQDSGRPETFGHLNEILEYLKSHEIGNAKIYWNMTWAYQQDTDHGGFANYNKDQMTMYNAITDTVEDTIVPNPLIDGVLPTGTAIQNLRTALGDTLTRDGFHLSEGIGRYTAALTWYSYLTGKDASTVTWTPADFTEEITPHLEKVYAAVNAAIANPYEITDLS